MPDDKFTEFLLDLITNDKDLLKKYVQDPKGVIEQADLTAEVKKAFAKLPKENDLRFRIQNTQGFKGVGPVKKAAKRKATKKAAAKKKAPAKKVAKGGRKR